MQNLTPKGTPGVHVDDIHALTRDLRRLLRMSDANLQAKTGGEKERLLKEWKIESMKHSLLMERNKVRELLLKLATVSSSERVPQINSLDLQSLKRLYAEERRTAERLKNLKKNVGVKQPRTLEPGLQATQGASQAGGASGAAQTSIPQPSQEQHLHSSIPYHDLPSHQSSFQAAPAQHQVNHHIFPQQNWLTASMPQTNREYTIRNPSNPSTMSSAGFQSTMNLSISSAVSSAGFQPTMNPSNSSAIPSGRFQPTMNPSTSSVMSPAGFQTTTNPSNSSAIPSGRFQPTMNPSTSSAMSPAGFQIRNPNIFSQQYREPDGSAAFYSGYSQPSVCRHQKLSSNNSAMLSNRQQSTSHRYFHENMSTGNISNLDGQQVRRSSYSTPRSSSPYRQEQRTAIATTSPSLRRSRHLQNSRDFPQDLGHRQGYQDGSLGRLQDLSGLPCQPQPVGFDMGPRFARSNSVQTPLDTDNNNKNFSHSSRNVNSPISGDIVSLRTNRFRQTIQQPSSAADLIISSQVISDSSINALYDEEQLTEIQLPEGFPAPTGPEALHMLGKAPDP